MRKTLLSLSLTALLTPLSANASSINGLGIGINYGAFSGPALEISYPITETLQLRGALSSGMNVSETESTDGVDYDVSANGGINRLALDYHPFNNGFFLSAGYAINNFALDADGDVADTETVTIGDTDYTATSAVKLNGNLDWDNAPTLSIGWGHSPSEGLGFLIEVGAYFTGAPDVSLNGSGTVSDGTTTFDVSDEIADEITDDIRAEEKNLQDDVGDYDLLPMLQAGITYRF